MYRETRLSYITELLPLFSTRSGFLGEAGRVLLFAGIGIVAVPYLAFRTYREKDRERWILWLVLLLACTGYLAMALQQRRWSYYLVMSAVLPYTLLVRDVMDVLEAKLPGGWERRAFRSATLFALIPAPFFAGILMTGLDADPDDSDPASPKTFRDRGQVEASSPTIEAGNAFADGQGRCPLRAVSRALTRDRWFPESELILAHTDHGPELLYRTHHSVLSIPNHRFQPGYTLTHEILSHPSPSEAAAKLRERGVGIVVLCAADITSGFFRYPEEPTAFVDWLAEGGIPEGYALHVATPAVRIYRRDD